MKYIFGFLTVIACLFAENADAQSLRRRTRLPAVLKEVSGITRLPNGDLWLLNDGGNPPRLYRWDVVIDSCLEVVELPVANKDWEELCNDPSGNLYIGDFGNNLNSRKDLCIYRYHPVTGKLDSIVFTYPDQNSFPPADTRDWNFDCEAMVFLDDSLHLFSKNRFKSNFAVKHYVLPAQPGRYVAQLKDSITLKNRVVSGAAISKDGKTLALTSYMLGFKWGFIPFSKASTFYFSSFTDTHFFAGKKKRVRLPKFLIARQFESVLEWSPGCWLAANEGIGPQRQSLWKTHLK